MKITYLAIIVIVIIIIIINLKLLVIILAIVELIGRDACQITAAFPRCTAMVILCNTFASPDSPLTHLPSSLRKSLDQGPTASNVSMATVE